MIGQKSISVLIPFYNTEKYLAEAIQSVFNQTVEPEEIILLDDGSTDESAKVAERFVPRITLFHQENAGISAARNALLKKANAEYIAFLDADDLWPPDHLKKLLEPFKSNNDLGIASGHVEQFLNDNSEELSKRIPEGQEVMPGYVAGASLIKKEVFDEVGLFDENLALAEFIDWFSRAKDAGYAFKLIEDIVLKRRIHSSNIGIQKRDKLHDYTKVLMASIKRKREQKKKESDQ